MTTFVICIHTLNVLYFDTYYFEWKNIELKVMTMFVYYFQIIILFLKIVRIKLVSNFKIKSNRIKWLMKKKIDHYRNNQVLANQYIYIYYNNNNIILLHVIIMDST